MAEYIERSAALNKLDEALVRSIESGGSHEASGLVTAKCQIAAVPAADVVEVVRCKDCVKRKTPRCAMWYDCQCGGQWSWETNNVFCSYGERREE